MNKNPRFTKHLIKKGFFVSSPLVVLDAGARGGFEDHWKWFGNQVRLIGFEPNEKECEKLNDDHKKNNKEYHPIALGAEKGKRILYLYSHRPSSSFYKPNVKLLQRFPDYRNAKIEGKCLVAATDLDSFISERGIGAIDFMKIDTEGAEYDILHGGKKTLSRVLGISLEVWFYSNRNQKRFSDIDMFLSSSGFTLFDLVTFRSAKIQLSPFVGARVSGLSDYGQIIVGQALYLRDAVEEISERKKGRWDEFRICKLASIMELFSLPDCAIELLMYARQKKIIHTAPHVWYDLLTPALKGRYVSYDDYMRHFKSNPPQRYPRGA